MFNELETLINTAAPYLKDMLISAFKAFDRINLENYQDGYLDIISMVDNEEINVIIDNVRLHTLILQSNLLKAHGIVLIEDVTIEVQTLFINAILDIQDYDDLPTLQKIVTLDLNSNEILAELVSLVTHKNSTELLMDIYSVSDGLITKVKSFFNDVEDNNIEYTQDDQKYILAFNKFIELINTNDLEVTNLLTNGVDVGYPFTTYLSMIGDYLINKNPLEIARELLAAAYISSDGINNPLSVINSNIDNYIVDIDEVTAIQIKVTELLLAIQRI